MGGQGVPPIACGLGVFGFQPQAGTPRITPDALINAVATMPASSPSSCTDSLAMMTCSSVSPASSRLTSALTAPAVTDLMVLLRLLSAKLIAEGVSLSQRRGSFDQSDYLLAGRK